MWSPNHFVPLVIMGQAANQTGVVSRPSRKRVLSGSGSLLWNWIQEASSSVPSKKKPGLTSPSTLESSSEKEKQTGEFDSFAVRETPCPSSLPGSETLSPNDNEKGRLFQEGWKIDRPWLQTNDDQTKMFCQWCAKYFPNSKSNLPL